MLDINNIYLGDNLELLKQLDDNSIHSCVSDFPYNLSFMGRKWDTIPDYYKWCNERAKELLRVLKPGGYCLIFGGTRTHHRLVCAFEDAGFEIRDEMQWIYGSGFPKSYNISKGFDKQAGVERKVIGKYTHPTAKNGMRTGDKNPYQSIGNMDGSYDITESETDLAKQWDGWGTALKPAQEPIMVAQKPIEKNYCYNVEKYGVGGINIDDSRIQFAENDDPRIGKDYKHNAKAGLENGEHKDNSSGELQSLHNSNGRFPANIIFDEEAAQVLDKQSGVSKSNKGKVRTAKIHNDIKLNNSKNVQVNCEYSDSGGASRFFYCAKATTKDKTENNKIINKHPTVKPTDLIKYLIRLVTPPNGICLDICEGSGTHAKASLLLTKENYPINYIGFENDEESFNVALRRIKENN